MRVATHILSPAEMKATLDVERRGMPFLIYRDRHGDLRFTELAGLQRLSIGRVPGNDLVVDWDPLVSRSHAQLERVGHDWTLLDDGLSRNGSQVNGERVAARRRLVDGDVLRLGETTLVFRAPGTAAPSTVAAASNQPVRLTDAERRVLVALCRPLADDGVAGLVPATNREIADALHLSVDGVKTHVRSLFTKLGVGDLPQYRKRTELARVALEQGIVTRADLR